MIPAGFLIRKRRLIYNTKLNFIADKDASGVFFKFDSTSAQDTFAFGKHIAGFLEPGAVVAMQGELGSGKTCLAKGIACGLGVKETITSPTYTIIREYQTDSRSNSVLYHIDAYRLKTSEDFEQAGGREIINSNGISLVEWSGRIQDSLPDNAITVIINITGQSSRLIKIYGLENL